MQQAAAANPVLIKEMVQNFVVGSLLLAGVAVAAAVNTLVI